MSTSASGDKALLLAQVRLSRLAVTASLETVLQETLDTAEQLTGSRIGFFHFVDPDQETLTLQAWSTHTLEHMCTAEGKGAHYPISNAGVWVDCFHARKAVIHNDYASLPHRRGMPEGHAVVVRELVVPVIRGGLVTAIMGVGNKPTDYDEADVETLETLLALATDVVERKRIEEALAASEARFRDLFERMAQGTVYHLADGRISAANQAAQEILGLSLAELTQRDSRDGRWGAIREDGSPFPAAEHPSMVALRTGQEVRDVVMGVHNPRRGERVWILASAVPMIRPGEVIPHGGFVTFEDITARKRAEEERLRSIQREDRLQRLESLTVMAGGIAHDFNNLLTSVLGFAELARSDLEPTSLAHQDLAQVVTSGRRAADLSQQMLAVSGKAMLHVARVSLPEVIEAALPALVGALPPEIRSSLHLEPATITADTEQLRRVLGNLVTNAIEALEGRSGEICLRCGVASCDRAELDRYVLGESLRPGRYAFLEIADDGPGMDAATLGRIFDPFFSTKFVGRGLGIPEALGIARAHAGSLLVASAPARGTTVRLVIPEAPDAGASLPGAPAAPASPAAVPAASPASLPGDARAVLVVDDEPTVRAVARRTLERAGYRVLVACDGKQAVDLYRRHAGEVALVLLDLTMPVLDGDATLAELRRLDPEVRVVLSSGYSASEVQDRFTGRGVAAFLTKPYTAHLLRTTVEGLIGPAGAGPAVDKG